MSTTRPTTTTVFPHQTTLQVTPTTRQQRDDIEQRELRQSAANILAQYSQLTMHTLASGESPAQIRLRMMRYLTGLPQPTNAKLEARPSVSGARTGSESSKSLGERS